MIQWWLVDVPTALFAEGIQGGALALQAKPNFMAVAFECGQDVWATVNMNYVQHSDRRSCASAGDRIWIALDLTAGQLREGDCQLEQRAER